MTELRARVGHGLARSIASTALPTAGVVGTLLNVVNHGEALMAGELPPRWWMNYVVPFVVSSWSIARTRPTAIETARGDG